MSTQWQRGRIGEAAAPEGGEQFLPLVAAAGVTIEEIVSSADTKPTAYEQDHDEWVLLVDGRARLTVAGEVVELRSGDWLWLPAGVSHVVESVEDGTRWLGVHLPPGAGSG